MRRFGQFFFVILTIGALASACSRGYESQKSIDDVKITLSVDRYPLVKGNNTITVRFNDRGGSPVTDGQVSARYFMPPMPGMAPMDFNTQALITGDRYTFSANVPMEGGWKFEITLARPGKPSSMATFNLDAR